MALARHAWLVSHCTATHKISRKPIRHHRPGSRPYYDPDGLQILTLLYLCNCRSDRNVLNGDGCSSTCKFQDLPPPSAQPSPPPAPPKNSDAIDYCVRSGSPSCANCGGEGALGHWMGAGLSGVGLGGYTAATAVPVSKGYTVRRPGVASV